MPSTIPKIIHLFWAGPKIPDFAVDNIISYIRFLPKDAKIYLWLTEPKSLLRSKRFLTIGALPACLVVKKVSSLLNSDIFAVLNQQFPQYSEQCNFRLVKDFIERELIGLGNAVAVKDAFVPLCLFRYGGYYFDLDTKAVTELSFPNSEYGVLVRDDGRSPQYLATEKSHLFCVFALIHLIKNIKTLPEFLKTVGIKIKHHSDTFFNTQVLRNRNNPLRSAFILVTTGAIIRPAFIDYAEHLKQNPSDLIFCEKINFSHTSIAGIETLTMGITFLNEIQSAPQRKNSILTKIKKPEPKNYLKAFKNFLIDTYLSKIKKAKKTTFKNTSFPSIEIENWRYQKVSRTSFELSDVSFFYENSSSISFFFGNSSSPKKVTTASHSPALLNNNDAVSLLYHEDNNNNPRLANPKGTRW